MYVCNQCDYQAITNNCLKTHSVNHHDSAHKSKEVKFKLHNKLSDDLKKK